MNEQFRDLSIKRIHGASQSASPSGYGVKYSIMHAVYELIFSLQPQLEVSILNNFEIIQYCLVQCCLYSPDAAFIHLARLQQGRHALIGGELVRKSSPPIKA